MKKRSMEASRIVRILGLRISCHNLAYYSIRQGTAPACLLASSFAQAPHVRRGSSDGSVDKKVFFM